MRIMIAENESVFKVMPLRPDNPTNVDTESMMADLIILTGEPANTT